MNSEVVLGTEIETLAARIVDGELKLNAIGQDDPRWAAGFEKWLSLLAEYERVCRVVANRAPQWEG